MIVIVNEWAEGLFADLRLLVVLVTAVQIYVWLCTVGLHWTLESK